MSQLQPIPHRHGGRFEPMRAQLRPGPMSSAARSPSRAFLHCSLSLSARFLVLLPLPPRRRCRIHTWVCSRLCIRDVEARHEREKDCSLSRLGNARPSGGVVVRTCAVSACVSLCVYIYVYMRRVHERI